MTGIIITAIVCGTILTIYFTEKKNGGNKE